MIFGDWQPVGCTHIYVKFFTPRRNASVWTTRQRGLHFRLCGEDYQASGLHFRLCGEDYQATRSAFPSLW